MKEYKNKYRSKSSRLQSWNYTTPWWYFITICTKNRINYFGEIKAGKVVLNNNGEIAKEQLLKTSELRKYVEIDEYIIMPNHVHAIIILNESNKNEIRNAEPDVSKKQSIYSEISPKPKSLSSIIRSFKSAVTNNIHKNGIANFQWQPRFYDRIIRNEKELFNVRKYIQQNPLKWEIEKDYQKNINF